MALPELAPGLIHLVDIASDVREHLDELVELGVKAVGRYYGVTTAIKGKFLTRAEADAIASAGLKIVSIFENEPADEHKAAEYFTNENGLRDGIAAWTMALECGQPQITPVYFAVDFDASILENSEGVYAYFRGLWNSRQRVTGAWRIAVYGSGSTCLRQIAMGHADHGWLANAEAWSGYKLFTQWAIKQGQPFTEGGLPSDRSDWNVAWENNAGLWTPVPEAQEIA